MDIPRPILLVFPFGYLSHYLRCLALCQYLKDSFRILFAYHEQYSRFVESQGFESFPVISMDEATVLEGVRSFDFSWLNEQSLQRTFLSQVDAIRQYRPAAVLGDATPSLKMAAGYTQVCFISLLNGYMSKHYARVRRLPASHPAARYLVHLPSGLQDLLTGYGERAAMRGVHRPFRRLRARYGLPPCRSYLDELEGDLTLLCDLPRLFPQKGLPQHYEWLGPLLFDAGTPASLPGSLTPGRKTIFVSMGSTGDWHDVAFLNDPGYSQYNIIAAGDAQHILDATHIIRTSFVSPSEIFPHADLVICHGGNGTLYQALAYGVPVLCKPAHFEQEWNLAALRGAGLAALLETRGPADGPAALIAEWTTRKGRPVHAALQKEVQESICGMPGKLKRITASLLQRTHTHHASPAGEIPV